ncbi:PREDICTED: facilitated trehalose transporter Tret1-like [Nicrophorus vespilloides]|uniref:Facilitated trehalose transporter Tret1-like n=1 Tax=Nicrophorus vespilloides TaxID=110193 RepID=A0ABM1N789_NICVS|nr:PREDICTED: facilitated trehalose transporter Tret1-like [Nicrophorus vespilloides]
MFFKNTRIKQYVAGFTACMSLASATIYMTWSSPALPILLGEDSPLGSPMDVEDASWMISIFILASLLGAPLTAYLLDNIGRKNTLLLSAFFTFLPWFLIIFANAPWMLYVARTLGGIGYTMAQSGSVIYIAEIADKDIRGRLAVITNAIKLLIGFLILSVGPFVSYTVLGIMCAVLPLTFFLIFISMPESPYYLLQIGKREDARNALIKFQPAGVDDKTLDQRLDEISDSVYSDMENSMGYKELFTNKEYRSGILIMAGLNTFQQLSGFVAIESYLQTIIESSSSILSPQHSSIIFGVIRIPGAIISSFFIDRLGRKPVLLLSFGICGLALLSEGTYFYLQDFVHANVDVISWLPTTSIVIYLIGESFGLVEVPFLLMGELFPINIKGVAVTTCGCYGDILAFTISKIFSPICVAWGYYTAFWIFTFGCIAGCVFIYTVVPETKGKTFEEIQRKLKKNSESNQ